MQARVSRRLRGVRKHPTEPNQRTIERIVQWLGVYLAYSFIICEVVFSHFMSGCGPEPILSVCHRGWVMGKPRATAEAHHMARAQGDPCDARGCCTKRGLCLRPQPHPNLSSMLNISWRARMGRSRHELDLNQPGCGAPLTKPHPRTRAHGSAIALSPV